MQDHRRPGKHPGRRLPLVAAACAAAAVTAAVGVAAAPASADLNVVSATEFTGSPGKPLRQTVTLSKLQTCGAYQGPGTIQLHSPSGPQPGGIPVNSSWTLQTVLECGLSIEPTNIAGVTVTNGETGAFEPPLNAAQVTDPSLYPGSDGALPTVSLLNEGIGQIQYVRPWLGGGDVNAKDNFTLQSDQSYPSGQPIAITVSERQPPLIVTPTSQPVDGSQTTRSERFTLSASVTTAAGAAVPSTDLRWSWSVSGSPVSGKAAPTLSFLAPSVTPVSVRVYDAATGIGGTTTFDVTSQPGKPRHAKHPQNGAGNHQHGSQTGNGNGKPKSRGDSHPKRSHHQTPTTHHNTQHSSNPGSGTGHQTNTAPASSTPSAPPAAPSPPPATTPSTPAAPPPNPTTSTSEQTAPGFTPVNGDAKPPRRQHRATHRRTHRRSSGSEHRARAGGTSGSAPRLVTGRLVADVEPVPPSSSPLIRNAKASAAPAPLVHAATTSTSLPTWLYAALAVVALLAGGAVYERRGRRGRSLHR